MVASALLSIGEPLLALTLPEPPGPYLWMLGAGFVIGIWGHGMRAPVVVAIGIAIVLVTTTLLILASQDLGGRSLPSI